MNRVLWGFALSLTPFALAHAAPPPADTVKESQIELDEDDQAKTSAAAKFRAAAEAKSKEEAKAKKPDLSKTTKPAANVSTKAKPAGDLPDWGSEDAGGGNELPAWKAAEGDLIPTMQPNWNAAMGPEAQVTFPWVEQHGYFRTRADLMFNFDLDTWRDNRGTGWAPPLTELDRTGNMHPESNGDHRFSNGSDSQSSANMRFRYQPTLHISENLRVRTTMDILDNVVLGSNADGWPRSQFQRPDVQLDIFSQSQRPPESGVNNWRDSVRVKHLWGEWRTPLGLLSMGRTMSHWGMGILSNSGNCLDCDFGDSVDRIMGVRKLFGTYLLVAWDFPSEGYTGFPGAQTNRNQPGGQAVDWDQRDDVNEWTVAIFDKPLTREEKETRVRDLNELRKPVFDWGAYTIIRNQVLEANYTGGSQPPEEPSSIQLLEVKAFTFTPDLWLRYEYRPKARTSYTLEFEAAGVFGTIEELPQRFASPSVECANASTTNIDDCPKEDRLTPRKRDILQWGYALEFEARTDKIRWGFNHGVASGDDTPGFGVLDTATLNSNDKRDDSINNFGFDRDYHVDMILFRELIGSVTNASYFKPYIAYDFVSQPDEVWGFQVSTLYAFALNPKSTPGKQRNLGLEFDLELYVRQFDRFTWSLQYGLLFPMGAFDLLDDTDKTIAEPGIAQTLQMMVGMQF